MWPTLTPGLQATSLEAPGEASCWNRGRPGTLTDQSKPSAPSKCQRQGSGSEPRNCPIAMQQIWVERVPMDMKARDCETHCILEQNKKTCAYNGIETKDMILETKGIQGTLQSCIVSCMATE